MNTLASSFLFGSGTVDVHESWDEFEFRPLIDVKIKLLLNILKPNRPIKTKFCIHFIIDEIYFGIVNHCFSQICNRVTALD